MRWLKRLVQSVLIYMAVCFPLIVTLQALTGYDFTAAYVALGSMGGVELALSAIIKIIEAKEENKISKKEIQKL